MGKNKSVVKNVARVATGSLLLGGVSALVVNQANASTPPSYTFTLLGSGNFLRGQIVQQITNDSSNLYADNHEAKDGAEAKCGEGKCGGHKEKASDEKTTPTPTPHGKTSEGKCGEGKCGS